MAAPDPVDDPRGARPARADGRHSHQAQSQPSAARGRRPDPAVPRAARTATCRRTGPQAVTVEDSMSMVHASRGFRVPVSPELRSEPAIVAGLARATLPGSRVPWEELVADYDRIRAAHRAGDPRLRELQRAHPPARRLSPAQSRGGARMAHARKAGRGSFPSPTRPPKRASALPAAAHDRALPRPAQHDHLRPWTTATAASSAGATCCS